MLPDDAFYSVSSGGFADVFFGNDDTDPGPLSWGGFRQY